MRVVGSQSAGFAAREASCTCGPNCLHAVHAARRSSAQNGGALHTQAGCIASVDSSTFAYNGVAGANGSSNVLLVRVACISGSPVLACASRTH